MKTEILEASEKLRFATKSANSVRKAQMRDYAVSGIFLAILLFFATLLTSCSCAKQDTEPGVQNTATSLPDIPDINIPENLTQISMTQEQITFKTNDGVTIVGDWSLPEGAKKTALLLHMMPATRESYEPLSEALNKTGFATLAIDLRGHGESTDQNGRTLNYKNFSDTEHRASRLDVDAAMDFLKGKGFDESAISFVGASIGANLAIDAMSRYSGAQRGVILSPGLDYRGLRPAAAMKTLGVEQKTWICAAEGDAYSADSTLSLQQMQKETSTMTIFGGAEHGTDLFASQANLVADIVKFLNS